MDMQNSKFLLGLALLIYLFFSLILLTKDPTVFPDEVEFANAAYKLVHPQLFSTKPFNNHLPQVDNLDFTLHGPVYFWILAGVYKIFGFSITTTRLTSVALGCLTLLVIYYLASKLFKDKTSGLIIIALLAIDYNFLRGSRFGRPEMATMLISYLTLSYYLKLSLFSKIKDYLIIGLLITLGIFNHLYLGLIVPITISLYSLFHKPQRKIIFNYKILATILTIAVSGFIWLLYIGLFSSQIGKSSELIATRLHPTFYSLNSILRGDMYIKALFIIYLTSIVMFLLTWIGTKTQKLLLILFIATYSIVFYGSIGWYLTLIPIPALLAFLSVKQYFPKAVLLLIGALVIVNLIEQSRLIQYYNQYSYFDYSKNISEKIPNNSKVILNKIMPDPYFYLAKERPDLKLLYNNYYEYNIDQLQFGLDKADYIVTYATDYQLLVSEATTSSLVIKYLREASYSAEIIKGNNYYTDMVIIQLN